MQPFYAGVGLTLSTASTAPTSTSTNRSATGCHPLLYVRKFGDLLRFDPATGATGATGAGDASLKSADDVAVIARVVPPMICVVARRPAFRAELAADAAYCSSVDPLYAKT